MFIIAKLRGVSRPNLFYYRKKIVNLKDVPFFSIVIKDENEDSLIFAQLDARKVRNILLNTKDVTIEDVVVTDGNHKRMVRIPNYHDGKIVVVDGYYHGANTNRKTELRSIVYAEGFDSSGRRRFTVALGENIIFGHDVPEVNGKVITSIGAYAVTKMKGNKIVDVPRVIFAQLSQNKLEKFLIIKAESDEITEIATQGFIGLNDEWFTPFDNLPTGDNSSFKALKTFSNDVKPSFYAFPGIVSISDNSINIINDFGIKLRVTRTSVVVHENTVYIVGIGSENIYLIDSSKQVKTVKFPNEDGVVHDARIIALGLVNGYHYLYVAFLVYKYDEYRYYLRFGRVNIERCSGADCVTIFPHEIPVDVGATTLYGFILLGGYIYDDGSFVVAFADYSGVYLAYENESTEIQGNEEVGSEESSSNYWESSPSPCSVEFTDEYRITRPGDFDTIEFAIKITGTNYVTIKNAFKVSSNEYAVIFKTDKTYIVFVDVEERRVIGDIVDISQFDGDYLVPFLFLSRESNGVRIISIKRRTGKAKIFSVFDDGTVTAEREIDLSVLSDPSTKLAFVPPDVISIAYFSHKGENKTLRLIVYHVGDDKLYDIVLDENVQHANIKIASDNAFVYVLNRNKLFVIDVMANALSPPKVLYTTTIDRTPDEVVGFLYAENGIVVRSGNAINIFVYDSLSKRGSFMGWVEARQLTFAHSLTGMAVPLGDHVGLLAQYANSDGKYITYLSVVLNDERPTSVNTFDIKGIGHIRYVSQELYGLFISDENDNFAVLYKLKNNRLAPLYKPETFPNGSDEIKIRVVPTNKDIFIALLALSLITVVLAVSLKKKEKSD